MSKHGPIRAERPTPSRAQLIHLLIEERAKVLAHAALIRGAVFVPSQGHRDQARREIEAEVLRPNQRVQPAATEHAKQAGRGPLGCDELLGADVQPEGKP